MNPQIAALCCAIGIAGLFWLNRDSTVQTSKALWLAVLWLGIVGSRNVGEWFQSGGARVDAGSAYIEGSSLDRNVLTILLAAGIVVLVTRWQRVSRVLRAQWPIALYFLYCGISILWSEYPLVGLKRWFRSSGDLVMVLVILTERNPSVALQRTLTRVGFVLLPLSLLLIRYFPDLGRAYVNWSGAVIWTGVAGGKNGLGQTCLIYGLAATWCCLLQSRTINGKLHKGRVVAQGAVATLAAYLIWLADSKTSLACLSLAAALIVVVGFIPFARKPILQHVLVLVLILVPVSVLFLDVGEGALESMGRDPSLTGRTDIWDVVLPFVTNPVVGAGYENFWLGERLAKITGAHGVFFTQAHNGYLELYLNLGWVGVALLVLLIVTSYGRITIQMQLYPEHTALRLAFFVVVIVYNFTEGAFKMMSSVWIALLIAAMSDIFRRPRKTRARVTKALLEKQQTAAMVC